MTQPVDTELLVGRCRLGDTEALTSVRDAFNDPLRGILLARGASPTEAEDLIADLWADCVPGREDEVSLLGKFSGRCSFLGWLSTVLTNRWIDLKRREQRQVGSLPRDEPGADDNTDPQEETSRPRDDALLELLRISLQEAFARCPVENLTVLRLVYEHGLTQREICRMISWSETRLSRSLSEAMSRIQRDTLRSLKAQDPWLDLSWDDLVTLCEVYQAGFW